MFWDNVNKRLGVGGTPGDFRLDVNGTARVQGALTVSTGGAQITGALQVLTGGEVITGNSRIITGQTGLTLGGNSDVQTLTENTNKRARINVPQYGTSSSTPIGIIQANANVSSNSIHIGGIQSGYSLAADEISFFIGATYNATTANQIARFFSTGNLVLQNGGTFTDAGFRLDVNGTARLNGLTTIQGTTASDTAPLGAELLTTGTGDASWTGTSFATGYTHVAGSVTTLTSAVAAVINTYYQITYTVTGRTAGSFTIAFGGNTTSGITATGATGPMATITGSLIITPTTDFNGTIVLSIRTIGTSSATTTFNDSTGVVRGEIRASTRGMFIGTNSGRRNTTGSNNSAFLGLRENTTGVENSAFGVASLINNNIGSFNSAFGVAALQSNRSGNRNNAFGAYSLFANVTGTNNQAFGNEALVNNTANNNQAFGSNSLEFNTTGSNNIAIGHFAGRSIADSLTANTITNSSIYIGASTKALADNQTNQIVIGHNATGLGSNTTVLGNALTLSTAIYGDLLLGQTTDNGTDRLQITGTARVSSSITAGSFIRSGGTSSQYLMADGSVSTLSNPITGTGTTNFLPKFTGGSTLGNSLIFDNGTNVGIGTTSPISKLHVNGDMRTVLTSGVGGDTLIAAINGVSNGYLINVDTSNNITHTWHTGGNIPSMRITSSGNVGIGTTSPSARLSVANAVTTTATVMAIGTFNNGLNFIINSNGSPEIASSAAVAPIHFSQGSTRVMTLSDNGNVGIGTTTPTALLHVNGQGRFYSNSSSTPALIVAGAGGVDNTNQGELRFGDAGNIYKIQGGEDYGAMNFITNNLPRLVIAANGNVGIGTTFPEAILDVASPTNRASMYISNTATSGTDNISEFRLNGWNGTSTSIIGQVIGTDSNITTATANAIIIRASRGSGVIRFDTGGNNERMRIDASGNLGIGITNPAYRLDVNGLINSTNGISVGGEGVSRFWTGTQAQYDAITTKVSTTVYLIT